MRIFLEYAIVKGVLLLTKLLPKSAIYGLCKALAALIFHVDPKRRYITLTNLERAHIGANEPERLILAKKIYESVGILVAEIFLMMQNRFDLDAIVSNYDEAIAMVDNLFKTRERGTLFLTAHFGNWELLAHFVAKHGYPMLVIGRKGNNPLIEERLTAPFRKLYGNALAYKEQAISAMVKTIKKQGITGMLIDQKAGGANSVKTTFFGNSVDTVTSTALLKLRYDPAVVPLFMARQSDGRYKVIMGSCAEIDLPETLSDDEKIARLTQHYNDIIEEVVRAYPEQWFWMHDRWRIGK